MHSSTSSSKTVSPAFQRVCAFSLAFLIFAGFVAFMEFRLSTLGYRPSINDSIDRWATERARASRLGSRGLILVGASRIQLALDTDALRKNARLEPVMLAIDGASFVPVLADLASDPEINGVILCDYYDHTLASRDGTALATLYASSYHSGGAGGRSLEERISAFFRSNLASFADGANPFTSLVVRIAGNHRSLRYLTTQSDRSRTADYSLVPMPAFYYMRVARNLGIDVDISNPAVETDLRNQIAGLPPAENGVFRDSIGEVARLVETIRQRGGRVIFVQLPSGGMVREIEEKRYPAKLFRRQFATTVNAPLLLSSDHPQLATYNCPDGSHLDMRDRKRFTEDLVAALVENNLLQRPQDEH